MKNGMESWGRTLVIAPHPDDEILGAGGTMARLSSLGQEVFVAVVTSGKLPLFTAEATQRVQAEAARAHKLLGVKQTFWLDQPAAELTEVRNADLNAAIDRVVKSVDPQTILAPFIGDMHVDHQLVFRSVMVAARPHQEHYVKSVLAYETLSETNWNAPYVTAPFVPNVFMDISDHLDIKISAMQEFRSQLRSEPHERSVESLRALAKLRGATIHRAAAEAFVLLRQVV